MDINKLSQLSNFGFSIIPCSENKAPIGKWKDAQTKARTESEILELKSPLFGIVTGFNNLEVIDIDLKVLSTKKEQTDFWIQYLKLLNDNIYDFDEKFVIVKTINNGFHILYKCKNIEKNKKIAKLKGHTGAIVETRGIGGMVIAYDNFVSKLDSYAKIKEITVSDREILFSCSTMYNYIEPDNKINVQLKNYEILDNEIAPWTDYNNKTNIFDVIASDFQIVGNQNDKIIIKRIGATSAHSGYIFKKDNIMYLHSTGTIFPAEKPINPFSAYTYKNHNGDFSQAAKKIYLDGFGTRKIKKQHEPKEKVIINQIDLQFPIDIFPSPMQSYILECQKTLDSSIDYMGCSLIWLISLSIGNSMKIEVKKGWLENAVIWMAIVGKAGIGKTPSISNIIFPLEKINNREIANYIKNFEKYEFYNALSKKDKEEYSDVDKPLKKQFIANDITLEALVDLHEQNDNAVGVFKDELAGWFKDMNKYKQGSDLEFWLSTWSSKSVNLNRITRAGSFVSSPMIPVLGGIQPGIFNQFTTETNKENGFLDRMLLSFPELKIEQYNDNEIDYNVQTWYSDTIISFFQLIKNSIIKRDKDGDIEPIILKFNKEAKNEWKRIFNEITAIQNNDSENEYMKSMLPKQKSYIPRFALLIHVFNGIGQFDYKFEEVSKQSILSAEKLSKYFIAMAKKVKLDSIELQEIKSTIKKNEGKTNKDKFTMLFKNNPDLNKKEVSEQLGVSLQMIYKYIKEIK